VSPFEPGDGHRDLHKGISTSGDRMQAN